MNLLKTQKSWFWIACASLLLPVLASGIVVWRANHAAGVAASETAAAAKVRFTVSPVNAIRTAGMDAIATPAGFRDIAVYRGHFYLSGPSGLLEYDTEGKLLKQYRVGLELPAAELGTMSQTKSQQSELFISTQGAGVLAFDGRRFRQIRPVDPAQANTTTVLSLSTGRLLIGTEHGLLVYDGRSLVPFATELGANYITALAGIEGDLWIGTLRDGLFHYHAGQLDVLKSELPDPQILSIAQSGDAMYAGTPVGVVEFRSGRRTRMIADSYFATSILADDRCLRVGTEDEGVVNVPLQARGCRATTSVPIRGAIRRIATSGGEHYALTDDAVYRMDGQRVIAAASGALTNRNISALAIGRGGKLWVGYFDRGLDILEPDFDHVTHLEDDRLFCVNRIVPDATGERTAVASANGLILFDSFNRVRQVLTRKDGLIADHITDVVFRPGGMIAATAAGLSFIDATGVHSLYAFQGLVNNHVYALANSGTHTMAGTLGGISSVENDTVRVNYDTANSGLKHNWITAIVAAGGDWFAGTYGAGVFRLDRTGRWEAFPDLKEGFIVNPNAMVATESRIYAGSLGRGLFLFDRSSNRWTAVTVGLPSLNVTALAENNGYLYIGTDNGLVRAREGALR